jgi:hypothetical protein
MICPKNGRMLVIDPADYACTRVALKILEHYTRVRGETHAYINT